MEMLEETSAVQMRVVETRKVSVGPSGREDSAKLRQCRICLQSQEESNDQMIAPCGCTGSVQFIHASCFNSWMLRKYEDPVIREQIISNQGLRCELCQQRYMFTYAIQLHCATWQYFKNKVSRNKFLLAATVLFILIDLILLVVVSWYADNDLHHKEFDINQPRFFLVYIALTFALCSLLYGLYQFIKIFMLMQKFVLSPQNRPRPILVRKKKSGEMATLQHCETFPDHFNRPAIQVMDL